jgi:hypothetical protein
MVLYNPFEQHREKRRPDRIIGFQRTGSFGRRPDETARQLQNDAGIRTIGEMIQATVLNDNSGPLLFPFLVIEAKSEHGKAHSDCDDQTAFPIWKMLKIQEELQDKSELQLDYRGPLLLYISCRGDDCRLFGCYIGKKDGKKTYVSAGILQ